MEGPYLANISSDLWSVNPYGSFDLSHIEFWGFSFLKMKKQIKINNKKELFPASLWKKSHYFLNKEGYQHAPDSMLIINVGQKKNHMEVGIGYSAS